MLNRIVLMGRLTRDPELRSLTPPSAHSLLPLTATISATVKKKRTSLMWSHGEALRSL